MLKILSDLFALSGVLSLSATAIRFLFQSGAFYGVSYILLRVKWAFAPWKRNAVSYKTFVGAQEEKFKRNRGKWSKRAIVLGVSFLAVSLLFAWICQTV